VNQNPRYEFLTNYNTLFRHPLLQLLQTQVHLHQDFQVDNNLPRNE
jgi:hypothetical protein